MNPKSADRTLDIIEAFSGARQPLTLSELSRQIGVAPSSGLALLRTLVSRGYLYTADANRGYYPTRRLLEHARVIAEHDPLAARLSGILQRLRETTGETAIAGKLEGLEVVYLQVAESRHTIRYATEVGARKPLHSSAMGKALLGQLPDSELEKTLKKIVLPRVTPNTITSKKKLVAEIRAGRDRGWFSTRGENVIDVMAISAAHDLGGITIGFTIAGPVHRMEEHYAEYVDPLRNLPATLGEAA